MVQTVRVTPIFGRTSSVVSNDAGDFWLLPTADANAVGQRSLDEGHPRYADLRARGVVGATSDGGAALERAVIRTRRAHAFGGPNLHIFVVTLRCDHSCPYCQVSRSAIDAPGKDMPLDVARDAVERVFESPARDLTIEFQGGEPALRFDLIRHIVGMAEARNRSGGRRLSFTLVSTLHPLTDDDLAFCRDHGIQLSTSIDGPQALHERQRPNPDRDSWRRTVDAIARARRIVGPHAVAALPTITRGALGDPEGVVDTYRSLGFSSVFLRPLSPFGFARRSARAIGYDQAAFSRFYEAALDHILELNRAGEDFQETYAAIALRRILTPFGDGYVDLRSPAGAGLNVLVYNYDGHVYPSDEARMAAEAGDHRFRLGRVDDRLETLISSPAMAWLSEGAVAERLPGCRDCAFVPFCGADPVHHAAVQGDPVGDRATSLFCARHTGLFQLLFRLIDEGDPETLRTFQAWALRRPRAAIRGGWLER